MPLERCLAIGNACGALSTRAVGGTEGQPTMDEVLDADRTGVRRVIVCLAANPSIDKLFEVDRLVRGDIHRPDRLRADRRRQGAERRARRAARWAPMCAPSR